MEKQKMPLILEQLIEKKLHYQHTPIRSITVAYHFSNTIIKEIEWDTPQHSLSIQGVKIKLTKTEYRLLYPLRHGSPLTYEELARIVYNCATDRHTRMMIDKHIDRIRNKLRDTGIYIYCILGYGYLLFNDNSQTEEEEHTISSSI
ncbi:MAG TPA: winged helix-turn-helix domain-containing protein [Ktedonobacteraceae bacterium]